MSKELLTYFDTRYRSKVGAKYPVNGGKDGKLLKDLRAIYSDADITRFMDAFFTMEDPFFAEAGWSLGCFRSCLPKVIAWVNRKGSVAVNWKNSPVSWRGELFRPPEGWNPDSDCPHGKGHETPGLCQAYQTAVERDREWFANCPHTPKCGSFRDCRQLIREKSA